MIAAVCGILFLSAGMVIITADSTDPAAQPTATVEIPPTEVIVPTAVVLPTDIPAPAPVQPTVVIAAPVVVPTDVVQPVQPTVGVVDQQPSPTVAVEAQTQPQATMVNSLPASPVPADFERYSAYTGDPAAQRTFRHFTAPFERLSTG